MCLLGTILKCIFRRPGLLGLGYKKLIEGLQISFCQSLKKKIVKTLSILNSLKSHIEKDATWLQLFSCRQN